MADKKNDPNDLFGQILTQWETMANDMANNVMGTTPFGKGQGAAMNASLKIRETMHEQMTRFLEVANMPSREEITELRSAVAKLDAKLDRIELKIDQVSNQNSAASVPVKGPPRTKQAKSSSQKAGKDG